MDQGSSSKTDMVGRHVDISKYPCMAMRGNMMYSIKAVDFNMRRHLVFYHDVPSMLLALCNSLMLLDESSSGNGDTVYTNVGVEQLVGVLVQALKNCGFDGNPEDFKKEIESFAEPVHVDVGFTSIVDIRSKSDLHLLNKLGAWLFHCFIVGLEDAKVASLLELKYYDEINTESGTQHFGAADRELVDDFLKKNDTQITSYGLQLLQERLPDLYTCVLFWNKQFSTVVKQNGRLYVLQNDLRSFRGNIAWEELCKPKCDHSGCSLEFCCKFNLTRHSSIHENDDRSNVDFSKYRDEIGNYWDNLTSSQASQLLSLEDMTIMGVAGKTLLRVLEKPPEGADPRIGRALLGKNLSSKDLFTLLDEASEKTLFSSDIRACKEDKLFGEGIRSIICDFRTVLASCSYMIEKSLVTRSAAERFGNDLIDEEDRLKKLRLDKPKKLKEVKDQIVQNVQEKDGNSSRHHSPKSDLDVSMEDTQEADMLNNMCDRVLDFLRNFHEDKDTVPFYEYAVKAMKCCDSLHVRVYFPHIKAYDKELASCIQDNYERVQPDMLLASTLYLVEKNYGKPEEKIFEGIKLTIHDRPSTSNMSFRKYVRENKLIKAFKIPKKYLRVFQNHSNGRVNILTYCGRKAARGYLNFIIKMHKDNWCWGGDWDLFDMQVEDGSFVITKTPMQSLTLEGMISDFKRYSHLILKPHYRSVEIAHYPAFFQQLQTDILKVPDPSHLDKLKRFQKYLSAHLAFMPPVSRSELFSRLFKVCDSLRIDQKYYSPLNFTDPPLISTEKCMPKYQEDWRVVVDQIPVFCDVFYFKSSILISNTHLNTHWHLLRYARNFTTNVLDYTKINGVQEIQDIIIADLMLANCLNSYLTELLLFIVELNNMDGAFFRAWQTYLKSDDKVEFEDGEQLESEDEKDGDEENGEGGDEDFFFAT